MSTLCSHIRHQRCNTSIFNADHACDHSCTPDLEEIVARYGSSTLNSSSPMRDRDPYDSSPRYGEGNDTLTSLPSSPPPLKSVMFGPSPPSQHQRASSHLNYADRIALFGSSPPVLPLSPFPVMSSRALARVEERHLNGFATPDQTSVSSPSAPSQGKNANIIKDRTMCMSTPDMRPRSDALTHAANFREKYGHEGSMTSTTPDLRSSRSDVCSLVKSSRERFSSLRQDEWMQAGSPEPELAGSGCGPEPTFSDWPYVFPQCRSAISVAQSQVPTEAFPSPPIYRKTGESSAAGALRQSLAASKTRKSSWTDKLFRRREPSPVSDDAVSEFGYEAPQSPIESPKSILERIRARGEALIIETREAADSDPLHTVCDDRNQEVLENGDEYELTSSPAESLRSLGPLFPEDEAGTGDCAGSITCSNAVSKSSEPLNDDLSVDTTSSEGNGRLVRPNTLLAFSSTFVAFDMAPESPSVDSSVPTAAMEQVVKLDLSAVEVTYCQHPLALAVRRGLSFATANALIHGCMSFAAIFFVLNHVGETIRGVDIGHDLVVGFLVGLVVVIVLHVDSILGGQIEQVSAHLVRSAGHRIRAMRQSVG